MGMFWHFVQRISSLQLAATVSPMNWGRACPLVGIVTAVTPSQFVAMLPQKWGKGLVCHAHKCARLQGTLLYHAPIGQMHGCKGHRHKCRWFPSKMGKTHRCSLLPYHPQKWAQPLFSPLPRRFATCGKKFDIQAFWLCHFGISLVPFWHKIAPKTGFFLRILCHFGISGQCFTAAPLCHFGTVSYI